MHSLRTDARAAPREASPPAGRPAKVLVAVALAALMLALVELALQLRAQHLHGDSVLRWGAAEPMYVFDAAAGIKLLRANAVLGGSGQQMRTDRVGLRNTGIPRTPAPGSFRAAVVGASSIMGAYARDNAATIPGLLQQALRERFPGRVIEVVNAGVAGLTVHDQSLLIEHVLPHYAPEVVIVYPGSNDFADYCRGTQRARAESQPLLRFELPKWLLSVDMLQKNTVALRETAARGPKRVRAGSADTGPFEAALNRLADIASTQHLHLVLATNARAYRRTQPAAEQRRLSTSARYFNPCFDVDGLHTMHERHNAAIVRVAQQRGLDLVRIDEAVPGGDAYFVDASHFNDRGNRLVAGAFARHLAGSGLVR